MKPQKGLGRGLEAIFSSEKIETARVAASETASSSIIEIPIDAISPNPTQPRHDFGAEELQDLANSIKELGLIQPITVREISGGDTSQKKYTIISGERRWRAASTAGLTTIPAYKREADDVQMHTMALVENLLREDLNPLEISLALQRLLDECGLTQEALAKRVSMKRSSISNYLRLLRLSNEVQFAIKGGLISMGHAKAIASIEDHSQQLQLLKLCIESGISVRQAEAYAQRCNQNGDDATEEKTTQENSTPRGFEQLSRHLAEIFPKGVSIKGNSRGGGKIVISYTNQNELKQLIKELNIDE